MINHSAQIDCTNKTAFLSSCLYNGCMIGHFDQLVSHKPDRKREDELKETAMHEEMVVTVWRKRRGKRA